MAYLQKTQKNILKQTIGYCRVHVIFQLETSCSFSICILLPCVIFECIFHKIPKLVHGIPTENTKYLYINVQFMLKYNRTLVIA